MGLIGTDLHTDSFFAVRERMTEKGRLVTEKKYALQGPSWEVFIKTLTREDYVLIEVTTNSFWFRERLLPFVRECFILNMNQVEFSGNKTDKIDARRLLDLLSYYVYVKGLSQLPSVYVPRPEVQRLRSMLATYRLQKRIIVQIRNRIHSLFKQHGIATTRSKLFTKAGWNEAITAAPEELRIHLGLLRKQLREAKSAAEDMADLIIDLGLKTFAEEVDLLFSIPGFGVFTAIVLLADVDNVHRFHTAKRFCKYLRTAPRIKESNSTTRLGPIGRQSRSMTCTILTQSVGYFKNAGPHFTSFYERVRVGKSPGRTRIALIRKMLVAAYYMLKRGTKFHWADNDLYQRKKDRVFREVKRIHERSFEDMVAIAKEVIEKGA